MIVIPIEDIASSQEEDVYAFGFDAGERGGDIYVRGVCGGADVG